MAAARCCWPSALTGTQLDILQSAFEATGADLPDDDSDEEPTKSAKPVVATVDTESIQKQVREIQAAEADRTGSIKLVCAKYGISSARIDGKEVTSLEAHAIREGWSAEKTELEALRASRPTSPAIHVAQDFSGNLSVLECAVAKSAKLIDREKQFDTKTLEAADKQYRGGVGLQRLLIMAASAAGLSVAPGPLRAVSRDFLRAAFSMDEISGILSNIGNKQLLTSYQAVESVWRSIAAIGSVNDFKTVTSYRLLDDAKFEKVGNDGRLKHAQFTEESFTNRAETHGKILSLTRQDIINDDLGALATRSAKIGRGAALQMNEVFWKEFLSNSTFFTTARKNYFSGVSTSDKKRCQEPKSNFCRNGS